MSEMIRQGDIPGVQLRRRQELSLPALEERPRAARRSRSSRPPDIKKPRPCGRGCGPVKSFVLEPEADGQADRPRQLIVLLPDRLAEVRARLPVDALDGFLGERVERD